MNTATPPPQTAPVNTFIENELPVWPGARDLVPAWLVGKTTWSHSFQSPSTQPTGGVPLNPTPFADAADTAGVANNNRTDCATNTATNTGKGTNGGAIPRLQAEGTLVASQLAAVTALLPAATTTLTTVAPTSGALAGGTAITLTGTGFAAPATVSIGGKPATSVVVASATSITCVSPAGTVSGPVGITVNGANGAAYKASAFTYNAQPSVIQSISPNRGAAAGGTQVTIVGTGFTGATGVTIAGTAATNFVVVSDSFITCTAPAHAAGAGNVVVTDAAGNGTLTNGYTYF
jgi:hypothetical protein